MHPTRKLTPPVDRTGMGQIIAERRQSSSVDDGRLALEIADTAIRMAEMAGAPGAEVARLREVLKRLRG